MKMPKHIMDGLKINELHIEINYEYTYVECKDDCGACPVKRPCRIPYLLSKENVEYIKQKYPEVLI